MSEIHPESLSIFPMTDQDLPQVLLIEQQSFPVPFSEKLFRMEIQLEIAQILVVKEGEQVLGYIDYWFVIPEIHLVNIAVDPVKRRKGIGALMMRHMIGDARKNHVEEIILDVRVSNEKALALYKGLGFRKLSVRKGYYQDNKEDALVMRLKL